MPIFCQLKFTFFVGCYLFEHDLDPLVTSSFVILLFIVIQLRQGFDYGEVIEHKMRKKYVLYYFIITSSNLMTIK